MNTVRNDGVHRGRDAAFRTHAGKKKPAVSVDKRFSINIGTPLSNHLVLELYRSSYVRKGFQSSEFFTTLIRNSKAAVRLDIAWVFYNWKICCSDFS